MPPHRTVEVVFEVRQPGGGLDERCPGSRFGPCETHTVRRGDTPDGLSESGGHSAHLSGATGRAPGHSPLWSTLNSNEIGTLIAWWGDSSGFIIGHERGGPMAR